MQNRHIGTDMPINRKMDVDKAAASAFPEQHLSKPQYHALLGQAKMSFSAALQETLGIAQAEATIAGAMPLSPRRPSYNEQYNAPFLYPTEWTASWDSYVVNKDFLVSYTSAPPSVISRSTTR